MDQAENIGGTRIITMKKVKIKFEQYRRYFNNSKEGMKYTHPDRKGKRGSPSSWQWQPSKPPTASPSSTRRPPYDRRRVRIGSLPVDRRGKIGGRPPELRSVDGHQCPCGGASSRPAAVSFGNSTPAGPTQHRLVAIGPPTARQFPLPKTTPPAPHTSAFAF